MFSKQFSKDFDILSNKILSKEPFAFARYADGEYNCIHNIMAPTSDKWELPKTNELSIDLESSLSHTEHNYYYGISCPCCDPPKFEYFKNKLEKVYNKVTFSNLFVNANFPKTIDLFSKLDDVVIIGNYKGKNNNYPFKVKKYISISDDIVSNYNSKNCFVEDFDYPTTVLISAGPISEILINNLFKYNNHCQLIDIGSALDPWIHKKVTRLYQQPSEYQNKECHF